MNRAGEYDVAVIGSGLGGLLSGALLTKQGFRVCVLEKHHRIGGNLQGFSRRGLHFNSAMHYVGAAGEGQILHKIFDYLGIAGKTGLEEMDPEAYEIVHLGARSYTHASGMEAHRERLLSYFPREQQAIDSYLDTIGHVWNSTKVLNLQDFRKLYEAETQYTQMNAHDYIANLSSDEDLRSLWGINSALYGGMKERSPLITHAIINLHYIQSAHKFSGGSDMLAHALAGVIKEGGGRVLVRSEVRSFRYEDKLARAALLADGSEVEARSFIANIHPAALAAMVEPGRFRRAYVSRVSELNNTPGTFCLYLALRPGSFRNINANVFINPGREVWTDAAMDQEDWPASSIMYTTPDPARPAYAESLTASAFMKFSELKPWEDTGIEARGAAYEDFKARRAEDLLKLLEQYYPGLSACVEYSYTATPLTFRDYTGTPGGSAYGIQKDCRQPRLSYISTNTRIPNLYLTGQNAGVGLHGVLGVSVSALFTLANFLDIGELLKKIRND